MIVSYKDRDEDRQRGLEAGAAYYLTKGSFHDETLLQAVVDLIGEAGRMRIGIVNDRMRRDREAPAARGGADAGASGRLDRAERRRGRGALREGDAGPDPDGPAHAGMDGVETTRRIMASTPCAILIVTGSVRANAGRVFEAMGSRRARRGRHAARSAAERSLRESAAPLLAKIATISRLVGDKARRGGAPACRPIVASPARQPRSADRDRRVRRRSGGAGHGAARPPERLSRRDRHRSARG